MSYCSTTLRSLITAIIIIINNNNNIKLEMCAKLKEHLHVTRRETVYTSFRSNRSESWDTSFCPITDIIKGVELNYISHKNTLLIPRKAAPSVNSASPPLHVTEGRGAERRRRIRGHGAALGDINHTLL